ncbi:MAG: transketolase [Planctomycetota bacterium]|nr:MAG: transketolase [Planctomycetota bacterium]
MARTFPTVEQLRPHFGHWQKTADMVDQLIDLMLNLRQSGHPGGSRSKVPMSVALFLSGAMRWDIRYPEKAFADRFVLIAGHCTPLAYGLLAVFNQALRLRYQQTGDEKYAVAGGRDRTLLWEDLLTLRRNGGLPGHAEMEGKTMLFKSNTGPSGHGAPAAVGLAAGLKLAGAEEVRVFGIEGEGGHTAGCHHESKNSAYGLGLGNLNYLMDWNDFGIDPRPFSSVVYGGPKEWFESYGFLVEGAEDGTDFEQLTQALMTNVAADGDRPRCTWFKTTKGRGYGITGYKSHGAPHKSNSDGFWETKKAFAEQYGVQFEGMGEARPESDQAFHEQTAANMKVALSLLESDPELCTYLADRLVELGDSVPQSLDGVKVQSGQDPAADPKLTDPSTLPEELFFKPGEKQPNRKGFAKVGAYMNAVGRQNYGRPIVIAASADLAESTNIFGFAQDHGDSKGFGWYNRDENVDGCMLPTGITEFANAGICCGISSTNLSDQPFEQYNGYWTACSTYGSFSYLKYGPMRLFSQLAQDSQLKVGKVIWVAGHSGPETAEDSRTHFGIYSPGITQFFPEGQTLDLHPWEPNEVGPALMAALGCEDVHIVALHLTRPPVLIPDREALGMGCHREAAKGAYLIRDYDPARPKQGCVFVRGTSSTASVIDLLRQGAFDGDGPNVKLVAAISHGLFARQSQEYRDSIVSGEDFLDSTFITNGAKMLMGHWTAHRVAFDYGMGADHDGRWRTGGSVDEIVREAHLDPEHLLEGIQRFVQEREQRLARISWPGAVESLR